MKLFYTDTYFYELPCLKINGNLDRAPLIINFLVTVSTGLNSLIKSSAVWNNSLIGLSIVWNECSDRINYCF